MSDFIPVNVPLLEGNEKKYLGECIDTGWISSAGSYVNKFEDKIAEIVGAKYGIACVNGTSGLHIAQIISGVQHNDYVIAPNLTFVATINSIKYCGADPILIDAESSNWQMDLDLLEEYLINNTEQKKIDNIWERAF